MHARSPDAPSALPPGVDWLRARPRVQRGVAYRTASEREPTRALVVHTWSRPLLLTLAGTLVLGLAFFVWGLVPRGGAPQGPWPAALFALSIVLFFLYPVFESSRRTLVADRRDGSLALVYAIGRWRTRRWSADRLPDAYMREVRGEETSWMVGLESEGTRVDCAWRGDRQAAMELLAEVDGLLRWLRDDEDDAESAT